MLNLKRALAPALTAVLLGGTALQGPAYADGTDLAPETEATAPAETQEPAASSSPSATPSATPTRAAQPTLAEADLPRPEAPKQQRPDEFNIATFNVLGASHRSSRSTKRRTDGAVRFLRKHKVSIVGLQEFERPQHAAFQRETNNKWTVIGAPSRSGKTTDYRNAIAFKKSRFKLVDATHMPIPYFFGKTVNIPVVTVRSARTGATFTMINTHNPADVHGPAQRHRNEATRRQVKKVKELRRKDRTVFVTGDMNEKAEYFCKMTRSGQMKSASGGSNNGRSCQAPKANGIDWIFGSRDVAFEGWRSDTSTRSRGISDHPIVVSRVTLPLPKKAEVAETPAS